MTRAPTYEDFLGSRRGRPSREAVYERLEAAVSELWSRLGGLPSREEAADIWRGIWIAEAHHSTAIEGNTLVLKQVEALLADGRAVGNKQLAEYMEVRGYGDAADWVYGQAMEGTPSEGGTISLAEIRHIHATAIGPAWNVAPHPEAGPEETPGSFRRHDIQAFPGGMTPPPWAEVPPLLSDWIDEANALQRGAPTFVEDLARAHNRFEQIHPFLDGNGRAGRLAMNLFLVRLGYPPAIIYKKQRTAYLGALRRADEGEFGTLGELIARAILDSLYKFIVPAVAGPARLVPLAALADERINETAMRAAAIRGRLQATKGADGLWRSSRNWVDAYLADRYRRRRTVQPPPASAGE